MWSSIVCDKVAVVGWGGCSLSLCWVGCHARLVVGSLPFSCGGGGGRSSLLLSSSGGGWLFGMVAGCMACCFCHTAVVVGAIGWGGLLLSLCWVGCYVCLGVGWLPFSHSSGGGHLSLLLSSSGGGWSFGVVAVWHDGRVLWLVAVVAQQWWWVPLGGVVAHCCCVGYVAICNWLWAHFHFRAAVLVSTCWCCCHWVAVACGH